MAASLIPLDWPSPSVRHSQGKHKAAATQEHDNSGYTNDFRQKYAPPVKPDNSNNENSVAPKAEEYSEWYTRPDWWVAGFTGALFFATAGLWVFTALLWQTTRRAVIGEDRAISAAEKSALIAERALLQLETASIFVVVERAYRIESYIDFRNTPNLRQNKTVSDGWKFYFVNYGRSPAFITSLSHAVDQRYGDELPKAIGPYDQHMPWGLVVPPNGGKSHEFRFDITIETDLEEIQKYGPERVYLNVCACFCDIFKSYFVTGFCYIFDDRYNGFVMTKFGESFNFLRPESEHNHRSNKPEG